MGCENFSNLCVVIGGTIGRVGRLRFFSPSLEWLGIRCGGEEEVPGKPPSFSSMAAGVSAISARVKRAEAAETLLPEEELLAHRGTAASALRVNWGSGSLTPVKLE